MSELKPCPFCGSADIRTEPGINLNYCDKCSAEANIEHWNTRPIEDALNKRIAELEAEIDQLTAHDATERQDDKWIPVSERLPELDQDVLAIVDDDIVIGSFGQGWDGEISFDRDEVGSTRYVTHWMPLPEPPEVRQ